MKNFKKVLALVLVMSIVMSFATISSAADFTDQNEVEYKEAVDVASAIGVIAGRPDGSFDPDGDVTRAEMAKLIAFIMNGGDDVGAQYEYANAFTDCTNHWAKGYIGYAYTMGIINGRGGAIFDPDSNVTGVEGMKMALVALGYDADYEDWTGQDWAQNIMKDARTAGLTLNFDASTNFYMPLSREEAAQLLLNALEADVIYYESTGTQVETPGFTWKEDPVVESMPYDDASDYAGRVDDYQGANSTGDHAMQLAEQKFPDLKHHVGLTDDAMKRPASSWGFKGKEIGVYPNGATYTFAIDEAVIMLDKNDADYDADRDGDNNGTDDLVDKLRDLAGYGKLDFDGANYWLNAQDVTITNSLAIDVFAGDRVEIFVNSRDVTEVTDVVIAHNTLGVIEKVDTNIRSGDVADGVEAYLTLARADGTGKVTYKDTDIVDYDEDTYVEGAALAIAVDRDGSQDHCIRDSYVAETYEGLITKAKENNTGITFDGKDYTTVNVADSKATPNGGILPENVDFEEEYIVYLTAEGYVMAMEGAEAIADVGDVYYVTAVDEKPKDSFSTAKYEAQAVSLKDGSIVVVDIEDAAYAAFTGVATIDANGTIASAPSGDWADEGEGLYVFKDDEVIYTNKSTNAAGADAEFDLINSLATGSAATYTSDSGNGVFDMIPYTSDGEFDNGTVDYDVLDDDDVKLELAPSAYAVNMAGALGDDVKSDARSIIAGGRGYFVDEATQFVSIQTNHSSHATSVNVSVGGMKMSTDAGGTDNGVDGSGVAIPTQAIVVSKNQVAEYVVYTGHDLSTAVASMEDIYYLASIDHEVAGGDEGTFYSCVTGEKSTLVFTGTHDTGKFYTYKPVEEGSEIYKLTEFKGDKAGNWADVTDVTRDGILVGVELDEISIDETGAMFNSRSNDEFNGGATNGNVSFDITDADIVDLRSASQKAADTVATEEITDLTKLDNAFDDAGSIHEVDALVFNGKIALIAVKDVQGPGWVDPNPNTPPPPAGNLTWLDVSNIAAPEYYTDNGRTATNTEVKTMLEGAGLHNVKMVNGKWNYSEDEAGDISYEGVTVTPAQMFKVTVGNITNGATNATGTTFAGTADVAYLPAAGGVVTVTVTVGGTTTTGSVDFSATGGTVDAGDVALASGAAATDTHDLAITVGAITADVATLGISVANT